MKHRRFLAPVTVLVLNLAPLWSAPCRAALGADAASVVVDQGAVGGDLSLTETPRYRIQEVSNAGGMRVREYMDAAGVVFAVSWSGPTLPDLRQLLGVYYQEYRAALFNLKPAGLHRSVSVRGPNVTVQLAGHMRAYSGSAYLPARVPASTAIEELR